MADKTLDEPLDDAAGTASDEGLKLKKRARRRLIGAIALALAAIVILPAVMDREPAPAGPEIQVRIPSQDTNASSVQAPAVASNDVQPAPSGATAAGDVSAGERRADSSGGVTPGTDSVPPPKPGTETKSPESAAFVSGEAKGASDAKLATEAPKQAAKPSSPGMSPASGKVEDSDRARAESALAGQTPPPRKTTSTAGSDKWIVQLGAYQNSGNVAVLMAKLKEMRVPAYTEKFNSPQGPRTRVRAGPFATKEEAIRAQAKARIIGVGGTVAPASADAR